MITIKSDFKAKEFSCSVPDVVLYIGSGEYADIVMVATKDGENKEIFNERLYPDSTGTIEVVEMDRLVEAYAEQWLVFTLTVTATDSSSATAQLSTQVVSCKAMMQNITAVEFCNSRFLTLLDGKRPTADGWLEFLTYIGTDAASCVAYYTDGTSRTFSVEHTTYHSDYSMIDVSPSLFKTDGKQLLRYVVTAGERTQEYEVITDYDPDIAPILLFFNSFGVQELAYCIGEHQMVSSYDRKQARIGRKKENYLIDEKSTFKADTGILTFPMASWWREVFRSKDVQVMQLGDDGLLDQNSAIPVVINTEKVEISNAADHLPRYTFEYEYADRNHNIFDVRREGRIFDNTFDYTFN